MSWDDKSKRELDLQEEAQRASEYIHECLYVFSDKKIIWLAEKCAEIHNYKKS
jgi:hypothetical protein